MMTPKKKGRPRKIDREKLHELMWERSDHRGVLRVVQKDLAAELGVTPERVYIETRFMREEERIKILGGGGKGKPKVFLVTNPEGWNKSEG